MNKTNKIMLIGNIILALGLMAILLTACTSNSTIQTLQSREIKNETDLLNLKSQVSANTGNIQGLQQQLQALQSNFTQNFNNLKSYIDAKTAQ